MAGKKHHRRWRVSVFALGKTDDKDAPLIHKASRDRLIAEKHFFGFMRHLGTKYEFVILHQGKGGSNSVKIWLDTRHVAHYSTIEDKIKRLRVYAENQRVDIAGMD